MYENKMIGRSMACIRERRIDLVNSYSQYLLTLNMFVAKFVVIASSYRRGDLTTHFCSRRDIVSKIMRFKEIFNVIGGYWTRPCLGCIVMHRCMNLVGFISYCYLAFRVIAI